MHLDSWIADMQKAEAYPSCPLTFLGTTTPLNEATKPGSSQCQLCSADSFPYAQL